MAPRLRKEELVTLNVLADKGQSNGQIAHTLGVTEGAVRYHRRRQGRVDGRSNKPRQAQWWQEAIQHWMNERGDDSGLSRPASVRALHDWLVTEHDYHGSYKSVLRFVRALYPPPKLRPFRRVETPAGAQAQVDWGEFTVDLGDGPQTLYGFIMVLSHSRQEALVWCRRMDQLAWQHAHLEAFRRLGGVAAVLRIDNLKTGVTRGAGPWGQINDSYRAFARALGFHVDACLPRCPEDKGKVENKVGNLKRRLRLAGRTFDGLADLQTWSDRELEHWAQQRRCPATGLTVAASWQAEQKRLRPLPERVPVVFDLAVSRKVQPDCTVHFEDRVYSVPFRLCGLMVEVRGGAEVVQVLHDGLVVAQHPRHSSERLLLDPAHYEGPGDERVSAPVPLGKMGRKLQEILLLPVEQRPLDLYAALAEVAR